MSGKRFIADYSYKREFLVDFFKSTSIVFDLNVDESTQKKIRFMQKKISEIAKNIKSANDISKKEKARWNKTPLNPQAPIGGINMRMHPGMQQGMPLMQPGMQPVMQPGMQPGMQHGMPPGIPGMGMPPMPMGIPMMAPSNSSSEIKMRIRKIIQDK